MLISDFSIGSANQDLEIIHDHLTDKLTGFSSPKLHLVTFDSPKEVTSMFSKMAKALKGHFHSYNTSNLKHSNSSTSSECKVSLHSYCSELASYF